MNSTNLMKIIDTNDVYTDSFLVDKTGTLVFISLVGKDTAIQELRARWSLPVNQGGLLDLQIETPNADVRVSLGNIASLKLLTGRLQTAIFGSLIQAFLFKEILQKPDYANRQAMQLFLSNDDPQDGLWQLIKNISPLPLMDQWRDDILRLFENSGWLNKLSGFGKVSAYSISIPEDELAVMLKTNLSNGVLSIT